jgi:hypothetical protein
MRSGSGPLPEAIEALPTRLSDGQLGEAVSAAPLFPEAAAIAASGQ